MGQGPIQYRGVRNGAEVERGEAEAENGQGVLPGAMCAVLFTSPGLEQRSQNHCFGGFMFNIRESMLMNSKW